MITPYWFHPKRYHWRRVGVDAGINRLVEAVNLLPGIRTLGSCEGHETPNSTQKPLGEWFVSFSVAFSNGGIRSLELIAGLHTAFTYMQGGHYKSNLRTEVYSTYTGISTGRSLWYSLDGEDCNPDDVATILRQFWAREWYRKLNRSVKP